MQRLAVIASGAGMRSSYAAGVLLGLAEKCKVTEPFLLICCSGSAGTGAYFVSKQYRSIRNIWQNLVTSKQMINPLRFWKIIDIDYLIDEIFKKQEPLNEKRIYGSRTVFLIPALNRKTGDIDYFCNRKNMDVFESMRATKAMPLAFNLNPKIKIGKSYYCDSPLSSMAETHIGKAVELGANKILLIDYSNKGNKHSINRRLFELWLLPQSIRKRYFDNIKAYSDYKVLKGVKILRITPTKMLRITTLNNKKELLHEAMQQGYQDINCNTFKAFHIKKINKRI